MAADPKIETTDPTKSGMDYAAHEGTYAGFLHLLKVGIVWCIGVLVCLILVNSGWNFLAGLLVLVFSVASLLWLIFGAPDEAPAGHGGHH